MKIIFHKQYDIINANNNSQNTQKIANSQQNKCVSVGEVSTGD